MPFIAWTEINLFHDLRKNFTHNPALAERPSAYTYRAKIKLHGNCMAVQILPDGTVEAQSRTTILTPEKDLAGFSKWVRAHAMDWRRVLPPGVVLFGEWCGPGIQASCAIQKIPSKIFAVFAALDIRNAEDARLLTDPESIRVFIPALRDVHVLPWLEDVGFVMDWRADALTLGTLVASLNGVVEAVEVCDPWVRRTFGVDGTGEGLVLYPQGITRREDVELAMWKAKGEKHRVLKTREAVQIAPEVAASVGAFVEMVLPEPRLEQGVAAVTPDGAGVFDVKRLGAFLQWITQDVTKETSEALTASGLDTKLVAKAVTERARVWYLAKVTAPA